jgi:tetratricopeptide (TPR) repeat protein
MHFRPAAFGWILTASLVVITTPLLAASPSPASPTAPRPASSSSKATPAPKSSAATPAPTRSPSKKGAAPADGKPAGNAPAPGTPGTSGAASGATGKGAPASTTSPTGKGLPEYADAWSSEYRPSAADLQLKVEDARKADAFGAFAQGLVAEDGADTDGMLDAYRRALTLDPTYAELAVKVSYELARRNDVAAGIQVLKDTIKAAPKEPLPYIYLSQLYSHYLKKPDLALTYAEQALALAPESFKSYLAVYELHDTAGQKPKAEAILAKAIKAETKDTRYWVELGEFLQKIYLKDDGNCSPEELKRMNAVYGRLLELSAYDADIMGKIADYYVLSKQVKLAIPLYLAVLRVKQDKEDPSLGNVREKLARSLIFTGQRDEAIAVVEEMVKDNPQRFDTYELLGELYEQKGDLDRAMANYEHSLLLDASEPRNHLRLAELLRQAKKYDQAVDMLQQAQKKFPDLPFITYGLALALSQAKRHDEAMTVFAQAQKDAESRSEELLNANFYFSYGAAAEQAGKLDRAAELLKQSIDLDPNQPEAYNYLGYMWADRGEHLDEAGTLIKKAIELDPEKGAYLDSLGWFYFKRGDPEKAIKELLRAQESLLREEKRDDPVVLDHIADTYSKLGKIPEALSYWQKAVALEQEDKTFTAKVTEKIEAAKQKVTSGAPMPEPAKQP